MDEKVEEDVDAVTTAQHGKRPRLLSYNSPATSDLFDYYFNDEICEEKVTDSLMSSRLTFEDHERDQEQVHGFEPLPSEHDDIGCTPLADSDNEDDTMTHDDKFWESGINNITTSEVVPLGNQAGTKYKRKIDPSKLAPIEVHSYKCCSRNMDLAEILIC
ncbi:uncharacterized protein [Acropora muricata]|uniref:uncharacterized protein n=1 Tax=Acropora muricata TaxID=159855 RepID=UPI0034E607E1